MYLGDLDPAAVSVELYADAVDGAAPLRHAMERARPLTGAANAYVYTAEVRRRPARQRLHTAPDSPPPRRHRPTGGGADPVAAVRSTSGNEKDPSIVGRR